MSLGLIPLCFIVDYIVNINGASSRDVTIFMLVIINYSLPFYYRREQTPTLISLVAFYVISIMGAFLVLLTSAGWVILIVVVLLFVYPVTAITTKYGDETYDKIDEEQKDIKGVQLLATPTQRKINTHNIYDTVILIVVGILFLLAKEHFEERFDMINKVTQETEKR